MRHLYDFSAKQVGVRLEDVPIPEDEFREQICMAIRCKITQNPQLYKEFVASTLPFAHYLVYGKDGVVYKEKHRWQMDFLEELRTELKAAPDPTVKPVVDEVWVPPQF
jgi:hypothetical protein